MRSRIGGRNTALRIVLCLVILALLCVPAVFVNMVIGYLPALFFCLLIALSFVYMKLSLRWLEFDELVETDSCQRGATIKVLLRVKNGSPLFLPRVDVTFGSSNLFGEDAVLETSSISIGPHRSEDFAFDLGFAHIGEFEVGLKELVVHDPLNLFQHAIDVQSSHSITVMPRLREVSSVVLSDVSAKQVSEALKPLNSSGEDYCGVREYVPGDPMKLIHWKLSARSESYFTKLFEEHSDPSLDIFLNLAAPDYDSETLMSLYDIAVETALSLELFAQQHGMDTRLVFLGEHGESSQFGLSHGADFRELMRRLPRIAPGSSSEFVSMAAQQATSIHAADNIAFCTASLDSQLVETLLQVKGTQRNAMMFALVPSSLEGQLRNDMLGTLNALDNSGVPYYLVETEGGGLQ